MGKRLKNMISGYLVIITKMMRIAHAFENLLTSAIRDRMLFLISNKSMFFINVSRVII